MIRPCIEDAGAFDPEAIEAMSRAFSDACNSLEIFPRDAHAREVVAIRIIELTRRGLTEPNALRERVIAEARAAA
jgi:hypothetical protein